MPRRWKPLTPDGRRGLADQAAQPTWEQVLAELTAENDAVESALHSGGDLPASASQTWQPPALPPLPPELATTARDVLQKQLELQARLALNLEHAPAATRRRTPSHAAPQAVLVDLLA